MKIGRKDTTIVRNTTLTNKKALRVHILERARKLRYHPFTRVSTGTLEQCEAQLTNYIDKQLGMLPSKGRTIDF